MRKFSTGGTSTDAIAVAIRRYTEKLNKQAKLSQKKLLQLLASAQINMKNNVCDITYPIGKLSLNFKPMHAMSGSCAETVIIDAKDLGKLNTSEATQVRKNLVEISVITPPDVETTPGFVHYISGLLAENNINLVEFVSCYTDTIFIVEEKDATKAYEVLRSRITKSS